VVATRKPTKITVIPMARVTANASIWPTTELSSPDAPVTRVPAAMSRFAVTIRPRR